MAYGKSSGGMGSQYGRGNRLAAALAPDAAAISNIKGNTQGLAYALEKGLQGLFAGMDAKEQKMFQTGFAEAMRPDPTTTIDMGTGDESEIDGAIDTVELTNSPGYSDELEFNEDQEVIGEAREVMGAGPALSESGLRGSGVAASSPMAIPGRDLSTRLTDFLSSPGMKNNRYAGNMAMPMAMQQMSQERKLQAAQLQRQQELQDLKTKQRDKLALKNAPGSMSGKTPSSIEEWNIFSNMSKEDKDRYLLMKRANPYMNIGGSMVQPRPTQPGVVAGVIQNTIPPEQTVGHKSAVAGGQEQAKADVKIRAEYAAKGVKSKQALDSLVGVEGLIDESTGSWGGAALDILSAAFGHAPKGAIAVGKLRVLQANLMLSQPRMEGPQSDKDVTLYKEAAGQIGDPAVPNAIKRAAVETIRTLHRKYAPAKAAPNVPNDLVDVK